MNVVRSLKKVIWELFKESFKMMIPYTIIIGVITVVNMIFFEIIVNNLFALTAYAANVDVIASGTLSTIVRSAYSYPLFIVLTIVIGTAILLQYIFLINVVNKIYVSTKTNQHDRILTKERFKEILLKFVKKIKIIPVFVYFIYFVILLSLFGINIENLIVNRIDISDVITTVIYENGLFTGLFILFKIMLLFIIAKLTPFIFVYALNDYSVKESFKVSNEMFKRNFKKIIVFLIVIFGITAFSDLYSYYIGDSLFYDIYASSEVISIREGVLFFISLPILIIDEFVTILFLLYFIHIFFDDDDNIDVENKGFAKLSSTKLYKVITVIIIGVLIFTEYISFQVFIDTAEKQNQIMVHRGGGNEVVENSGESIQYSLSKNYPAIEIDVMELKDGEIILIHDKTLTRVANKDLKVKDLTLKEIKDIKMIGGYNFITLGEALELIKDDDMIMNIEVKYHGNESNDFIKNIVAEVEEKSLEDRVYISSFDYESLLEVETLNSQIKTMYFSFFFLGNLSNLEVDAVGVDITYLSQEQFYTLERYGYEVAIFTVNKKKDMLTSLSYELEYIISDEPENLEKLIEGLSDIFDLEQ